MVGKSGTRVTLSHGKPSVDAKSSTRATLSHGKPSVVGKSGTRRRAAGAQRSRMTSNVFVGDAISSWAATSWSSDSPESTVAFSTP